MKHKSSRIVALTILYISIIFGIFIIQFTVGRTFSYKIESMSISGRHTVDKNGNTEPLLPLSIVSNGLNFYVSEQAPILAESKEKKQFPIKILAYNKQGNTFKITCDRNIEIMFSCTKNEKVDSVQISAKIPENIQNIYIPWKLTPTARLERAEKNIFLRYGKNKFTFRGNHGFKNSEENTNSQLPHLVLPNNSPVAFYETYTKSKKASFDTIAQNQMASDETFAKTMNHYRNKAMEYFNRVISSRNYNEDIAVAYIAEQAVNQKYEKALRLAPLTNLKENQRTYKSCTFYNNLSKNTHLLAASDNKKLKNISQIIFENNIQVFKQYKLLPFLVDNLKQRLLPKLEKIAIEVPEETLTAETCAGILEFAMDYSIFYPNKKNKIIENFEKYEKIITDSLLFIDAGLYISSDSKKISTAQTLQIANILIRYGKEIHNKKNWKSVGQMLYSSILNYSGESASIPAHFNIQGMGSDKLGLMADDSVILHAEQLYPLAITDNPNYPHRESLSAQSSSGMWAWTSADKIEVDQNTSKIFRFKISFKKGQGHHLIIRGIRPFYRIKIYGINYKSDPRFEIYKSSGYVYDYGTKTLLLKVQHKQETEEITLFWGQPPQPDPVEKPTLKIKPIKDGEPENKVETTTETNKTNTNEANTNTETNKDNNDDESMDNNDGNDENVENNDNT